MGSLFDPFLENMKSAHIQPQLTLSRKVKLQKGISLWGMLKYQVFVWPDIMVFVCCLLVVVFVCFEGGCVFFCGSFVWVFWRGGHVKMFENNSGPIFISVSKTVYEAGQQK